MSMEITDETQENSSRAMQHVETVRDSPPLLGVLFGILLVVIGVVLGEGAVAGMFGIYGLTVVVVSATIYAVLAVLRRNQ